MYETPGRATNWVVLFKFLRGIHTVHPDVIICMSDADKNAPIFLSRQETKYRIDLIQFATGKNNFNKTISESLLSSILKYGSTSVFYESTYEKQLLNGITRWIHCGDELVRIEDSEII